MRCSSCKCIELIILRCLTYKRYFRDYAILLPILDPSITPNACYNLSPLLFWAVIAASCRTYSRNPTLLSVLPIKIQTMALMSLNNPQITLHLVQGMLLLLQWPFPKTGGHDLTFSLSAAVLHLAMQIGLHLPVASQEFCKQRVRLTEEDLKIRAETWGYCTLVYQRYALRGPCRSFIWLSNVCRSCWFKGNPATPMLDIPHDVEQRKELFSRTSPHLKFKLKLQDVLTRCCIAVAQNGVHTMTAEQERSLDTLLNIFQAQISSLSLECTDGKSPNNQWKLLQKPDTPTELHHLDLQVAKVVIQAFTLWKSPAGQDPTALYDLGISSCRVLESFEALDKSSHICLPASGIYFIYSVMVPSHILLRLLKTSFCRYIDAERAKSALFLGISLHKSMSVQNDDIPARNGVALTQLWNSTRAFKESDGREAVSLRIRSRLTGSVVLDGIVWWREEFGGYSGVHPPPLGDSSNGMLHCLSRSSVLMLVAGEAPRTEPANRSNPITLTHNTLTQAIKPNYSTLTDDPMLSEFGWPLSDDIFSSMWNDGHVPII